MTGSHVKGELIPDKDNIEDEEDEEDEEDGAGSLDAQHYFAMISLEQQFEPDGRGGFRALQQNSRPKEAQQEPPTRKKPNLQKAKKPVVCT